MLLSVIIVNWNSKDLLRQCILSIREHAHDLHPQVVVVDGGSFDGCGEMLASEFPEIEFVQCKDNIGFGRANNVGFEHVTGQAVLLLNPDTELLAGSLHELLRQLKQRPDAGIIGPRLLNTDKTLQTSVQALPRPFRQAFDSEVLRKILWPFRLWAPPTDFVPTDTIAVEAVSGACMLLWTQTFRKAGGFSPQYFMYAEDADLCLKVSRLGLRIYHSPASTIIHHGGASSSSQTSSAFSVVMMCEALRTYMLVNHSAYHAFVYQFATAVSGLLRMIIVAPALLFASQSLRRRAKAALANQWALLSWSLGGQRWTRRYI